MAKQHESVQQFFGSDLNIFILFQLEYMRFRLGILLQ